MTFIGNVKSTWLDFCMKNRRPTTGDARDHGELPWNDSVKAEGVVVAE